MTSSTTIRPVLDGLGGVGDLNQLARRHIWIAKVLAVARGLLPRGAQLTEIA